MTDTGTLQDAPPRGADEGHKDHAPRRPPRKYVLFADGTGNAFTKQESNIWRLYEALDRTKTDQVAYYIKGVGTASWAPFAAFDGATGIGVPSNVRQLYRFLCWNWEPKDEIHIFGFSRGAFTARTLAGLISSQGLVPAEIGGVPVSHAEMERNAMMAWRAYREHSVPMSKSLPTIWIARWIRDFVLWLYHLVMRHRSYRQVKAAMGGRHDIEIAFLGMFDTVEAFGVPVEELRTAIDWAIWPISFRNRKLPPTVRRACHALALDDERVTFHPIRFDHAAGDSRVTEVWFAGMHSDVGGGYPDGTLSYVPLVWMVGQIGDGLHFQPGGIDHFKNYQSAIGPLHDSRSGAAVLYRYGPRPIGEDPKVDGGPPIIHVGVVERMLHGCDNYAPVTLPASASVMLPNGKVMELTERPEGQVRRLKVETQQEMQSAYLESRKAKNEQGEETAAGFAAADVFTKMKVPDDNMVQQTLDTVWWRRFWYFFLLAAVAFLAAWPLVGKTIVDFLKGPADQPQVSGVSLLNIIQWIDYGVAAVTGPPARLIQGFLPSYAEPWLKIAVFYPFATSLVVLPVVLGYLMNSFLRDRIQERARLAWNRPHRLVTNIGRPTPLLKIGRVMRLKAGWLQTAVAVFLVPGIFLVAVYGTALLAVGRSYFGWRDGTAGFKWTLLSPAFCNATKQLKIVGGEPLRVETLFETKNPCWSSGLWVEKDHKYRIWIAVKDPWFDRTIMTGVNGFQLATSKQLAAVPLRRWISADWFQPIARIGANADAELPLQSIDGTLPDKLPRQRDPTKPDTNLKDEDKYPVRVEDSKPPPQPWPEFGWFEPIPPGALPAAQEVWRQQGLASLMVADFTATASGELFLYVNDAIQLAPLLGPFDLFYKNNSGSAEVTVRRLPLEPPKQ